MILVTFLERAVNSEHPDFLELNWTSSLNIRESDWSERTISNILTMKTFLTEQTLQRHQR